MNIRVEGGKISKKEQEAYAEYARNKHPDMRISSLIINVNGEYVDLTCTVPENKANHRIPCG